MPPTPRTHPHGLIGIQLPLSPLVIIDGLDQRAQIITAPPPDLLHMAPMSPLLDKTGWRRGAHHNSSTGHDVPDAINCLRKTSVEGTRLEAATPADKEAPPWPHGLC
jgi:hypothetical protein